MTIELKLGVNDTCYFNAYNKVQKGIVEKIEVNITRNEKYRWGSDIFISYCVRKSDESFVLDNNSVFKTLEETLKYLGENVE